MEGIWVLKVDEDDVELFASWEAVLQWITLFKNPEIDGNFEKFSVEFMVVNS